APGGGGARPCRRPREPGPAGEGGRRREGGRGARGGRARGRGGGGAAPAEGAEHGPAARRDAATRPCRAARRGRRRRPPARGGEPGVAQLGHGARRRRPHLARTADRARPAARDEPEAPEARRGGRPDAPAGARAAQAAVRAPERGGLRRAARPRPRAAPAARAPRPRPPAPPPRRRRVLPRRRHGLRDAAHRRARLPRRRALPARRHRAHHRRRVPRLARVGSALPGREEAPPVLALFRADRRRPELVRHAARALRPRHQRVPAHRRRRGRRLRPPLMAGALAGLRVLDLADQKGALAGKLLADLGADVVLVEPPGGGSPLRTIPPFWQGLPHPERSLFFWFYNTSKRGITLDVARPAGAALLRRLAADADVLIESEPPGRLATLGCGPEALRAANPRLVVASITPFGQRGPYCNWRASDTVAEAMGGMLFVNGHQAGPPLRALGLQAYHQAGIFAAVGVLGALFPRERTGRGQDVDVSLQAAVAGALEHVPGLWHQAGTVAARQGTLHWTRFFRVR